MHHLYPAAKGDPLCPLGFHPQVRWPTRCKRCFRDYKEHGGRIKESEPLRRDDVASSSPSLSNWSSSSSRSCDDSQSSTDSGLSSRSSWAGSSSSDESAHSSNSSSSRFGTTGRPAMSWTSTPDLGKLADDTKAEVTTVSFTLPRRRPPTTDTGQDTSTSETFTLRRRSITPSRGDSRESNTTSTSTTTSKPSQERARQRLLNSAAPSQPAGDDTGRLRRVKIQSLKEVHSVEEPTNPEVKPPKPPAFSTNSSKKPAAASSSSSSSSGTSEEESDDDSTSIAGTETTETTLVDRNENELQEQIESLKQELEMMRSRCERVEREKSDLLLRRIAAIDMPPSKTAASEVLKLQQRVNDLQGQVEDYRDEKKSLSLRVKELEEELEARPDKNATLKTIDDLRSKLLAAETLCEELMDENEDMKKELRDLEEEIEEMQDNFREDQADEYSSLKKELEQTAKNCRILSFKLRKAERKTEQLEAEKLEAEKKLRELAGGQSGLEKAEKISRLEEDLKFANEFAEKLKKELDDTREKLKAKEEANNKELLQNKKKAPKLGTLPSGEKMSRESLTRGGSQDDPVQLLRDLEGAMEREADLREQLRFAEEEAQMLRKKAARMEDDNESLVLQLKKMATKARSRRHSPSPARLTPEPPNDRDEGISDEEDPAELRLLLELNEQETAVLRRKTEELEKEGDVLKKKVKELQEKLNVKTARKNVVSGLASSEPPKGNAVYEQKLKVLEEEVSELRKKLIDKERDCERLHAELTLSQKRFSKGTLQKSKSLDSGSEQQALDLKRQLQTIEQEAAILRTRTQALETENEKLNTENKKLQLLRVSKKSTPAAVDGETELREKITALEAQLANSTQKVAELQAKLDAEETSESKKKGVAAKDPDVAKLKKELKSKTDELEKLKTQMTKAESEKEKMDQVVKRLKEESIADALKFYKQRTPKKPTEFTTKLQMKKMVEELENEIGEVLIVLKKSEAEKTKLKNDGKSSKTSDRGSAGKDATVEKTLEETKKKIEDLEKELKEEKEKAEKERKKTAKEKKIIEEGKKKAEEDKHKLEEEKKSWDGQKEKLEETKRMLEENMKTTQEEKDKLAEEIVKLTAEKAAAAVKQNELADFVQTIEALKKELEYERNAGVELRRKLEMAQKTEQEKTRLQKENADKTSKLSDVEKKAKEAEDKLKKTERMLTTNKNKVAKLEKELEEERERAHSSEATQQGVAASWLAERDSLKNQLTALEATLAGKATLIEQLEANVKEEREKASDASTKASMAERKEISKLKDDLAANKEQVQELTHKLEKAERNCKGSEEKLKKLEAELQKEKTELEKKSSELENNISAERKKIERMKITHEKELKNRDQELSTLRTKIRSLESNTGVNSKKINEIKQEYEAKIDKLEEELSTERQEYEDLTAKYEILEEEHVVTKAQLVMEKETLQNQLQVTKRELASAETELRTLRETYNSKQDAWIKEKLDQQEKLKELEEKVTRNGSDVWNSERNRLKASIEEKNHEIEQMKREADVLNDQADHMKKENDELRRKLEDFDKVVKIQRNMSADTTALERQLRESKNKLTQEEKNHKAEIAQLKMRYDSQVAVVSDEIQALQAQVTRFKRERDTFRHMLEGAQKTITELKSKPKPTKDSRTSSSGDESEETQLKIASLEQQVSCMEDELSEARLESSKLKTELISERSSWEVKMSEMQSRINELEEDKILTSGRTKIPGMRTRMELAWQKEREEQHRLLQETSTLARDLRQTLFEVERERDKERLEAKRRLDQLKKSTEEEQEETRKKVSELQCDLLELRDAHAKLRTTNEKLRREKERYEKEREELRTMVTGRKRAEQEEERKVNALLEQVEELMRLAPELMSQKQKAKSPPPGQAPTPPIRLKGPKSRESSREASPALERKFMKESSIDQKTQLQTTVQRLNAVTEELRKYQKQNEEERDRERARRTIGMRRAASTESDNPPEVSMRSKAGGSLYRKSLSLEQTGGHEQPIWKIDDENDGSMSSLQSMESGDSRFFSLHKRETSMDSRLSGGSTQSEVIQSSGEKKKKKGILGKLKKLTKSRSIDETTSGVDYSATSSAQGSNLGGSGSDISMGGEEKGSKKDLREKFSGMFKKAGSRSGSLERGVKPPTEQSPALPERGESAKKTSTLPRPSPARSDSSHTSSISRPLTASSVTRPLTPLKAPVSTPTKSGQWKAK
ncbi:uncharacterized protein [Anabrus simplex]|uniref:uncharacterized protein isoform X2 n=1 Tax=Anabrus simplex TaxID=316456 RepID=UPI0035A27751